MKIYAPDDKSWVPVLGRGVEHGEEVDVDDTVGEALLDQGWTAKKAKSTGGTTTDASDATPIEEN